MGDTWIKTDKEKEAIYEYSDATAMNIANQTNVDIRLFFNGGHRKITINDNGAINTYVLRDPKKPDDTPTRLLRFGNIEIEVAKDLELEKLFPIPVFIEKQQ
jgi:hypothetical protein